MKIQVLVKSIGVATVSVYFFMKIQVRIKLIGVNICLPLETPTM